MSNQNNSQTDKCAACGGPLQPGAKHCGHCGSPVEVPVPVEQPRTQAKPPPPPMPPPVPPTGAGAPPSPGQQPPPNAGQQPPGGNAPPRKKLVKRKAQAKPSKIKCTNCGAPIDIKNSAMAEQISCSYCGAVLDLNDPGKKVLRKILLDQRPPSPLPLGTKGKLKGVEWEVIGRIRMVQEQIYIWDEFLLFSPKEGYAWLETESNHWTYLRKSKNKPSVSPNDLYPGAVFEHYGKSFTTIEKYSGTIQYVEGEFPYQANIGDVYNLLDAVSPPMILSSEWTQTELEWISGEYTKPEIIWKAFKTQPLPQPTGVAAHQPYELPEETKKLSKWGLIFACLFLVMFVGSCFMGRQAATFSVMPSEYMDGNTYTSKPIKFNGGNIVKIEVTAPVQGYSYIYLLIDIFDESGKKVLSYSEQITGKSRTKSSTMKIKKKGNYTMKIKGERPPKKTANAQEEVLKVKAQKSLMLSRWFLLFGLLCLIPSMMEEKQI